MFIPHSPDVTQELTDCLKSQDTLQSYYRMKTAYFQKAGNRLTTVELIKTKQCPVVSMHKNIVTILTFIRICIFLKKETQLRRVPSCC